MNFRHTPHPHTETHYYIQELINAQEKRSLDRSYYKDKAKAEAEREELIKDAKGKEVKPFWCETCKKDFLAESIKQVEVDWSNSKQNVAFYKTKCFNGHWCIRLITDRHKDAFWTRSRMTRADQGKYYADTLQPFQTGYNLLYGKR